MTTAPDTQRCIQIHPLAYNKVSAKIWNVKRNFDGVAKNFIEKSANVPPAVVTRPNPCRPQIGLAPAPIRGLRERLKKKKDNLTLL